MIDAAAMLLREPDVRKMVLHFIRDVYHLADNACFDAERDEITVGIVDLEKVNLWLEAFERLPAPVDPNYEYGPASRVAFALGLTKEEIPE